MKNIDKYISIKNLVHGQECLIYKVDDELYDKCGEDEVIYIGDYGLQELQDIDERGQDVTDEEIVRKYGASKRSIRQELKDVWDVDDEYIDKYNLVYMIWEFCDWTYTSTAVEELYDSWDFEANE